MTGRPVVAIVDAYSTARYFAPLFAERGYECLHVQSTPAIPAVYAPSFRRDDFIDNVVHGRSPHATARAVADHGPVALLAGIESGVELADELSEALGLRTNGTGLSPDRRDKFRMIETVKAAGLRGARQALVSEPEALLDWYRANGAGRVVVKPVKSAGNDGVYFCDSEKDVLTAFAALVGTDSALNLHNSAVLVQEYLAGVEYYVNTVSLDGVHYVCDIHSTQHVSVNGVRDLLAGSTLLPRRGAAQDALADYAFGVLDALGVRHGPAHTELKLTGDGPCLIETGARICGADLPLLVGAAIGESQLQWTVDAYVEPERFAERCQDDYALTAHAVCVNMISPRSGALVGYPKLPEVEALESYHGVLMKARPGGPIARTVNDFTYPMLVHLLYPSEVVVQHDYATVRWLDGDGFYEIA